MQSLKLSDSELDALYTAARPIAPHLRDEFLQAVADALGTEREIGPGVVFRVLRDTQRRFFDPPDFTPHSVRHHLFGRRTRVDGAEEIKSGKLNAK